MNLVLNSKWKRPPEVKSFAIVYGRAGFFPLHLTEGTALCSIAEDRLSCSCSNPKDVSKKLVRTDLPAGLKRFGFIGAAPHGPWAAFLSVDQKLLIINIETGQVFKTIDIGDAKGQVIPHWPSLVATQPGN